MLVADQVLYFFRWPLPAAKLGRRSFNMRRIALPATSLARATAGTIRLKLLKLGALVRVSVRRVTIAMASGHPWQQGWAIAHAALAAAAA